MEDRRVFDRFQARFPLRLLDLDTNKEIDAQAEDVSAKGVGFETDEELKLHAPLEMWLRIPDKGEPLYTRGKVAWSKRLEPNKFRVGVNLERADLMGISRLLRITPI